MDQYPEQLKQAEIDVALSWLERRLGKRLTPDEIKPKAGAAGLQLTFDGDNMHVVVPTWRSTGDVSIKADIMEEVARMYGYENFEAEPITTSFDGAINQLDKDLERRIKEYLAIRCGMQEIFTYPWMDEILRQRGAAEHGGHSVPVHAAVSRRAVRPLLPAAQPVQGRGEERALLRRVLHFRDGAGVPRRELHLPTIPARSCPPSARTWRAPSRPPARTSPPCSARPRAWWR